jgi:hypothetical protein
VIEECNAFISLMLQLGGGKKNKRGSLVIAEHMWNSLCIKSFPQAVGDKHLLEILQLL